MDRDSSIIAQVAAKVAGSVCCGSSDIDKYLGCVEAVHNDLMERAGAGIVADSDPALEHLECQNKARALLVAIPAARRMTAQRIAGS